MKIVWMAAVIITMYVSSAQGQVSFCLESMSPAGQKNSGFYQEFGTGWYEPYSTVKSKAEGLTGMYSRFSNESNVGDAGFRFYPSFHQSFDSDKRWDVYVTVPVAASVDAESAVWVISEDGVTRDRSGTVPLVGHGGDDGTGTAGDKWLQVASGISFAPSGGYIEFQENPPQVRRFYADAVRLVESNTTPTHGTPTITPTETATPTVTATPVSPTEEVRALWVPRGHFRNPDDVKKIITNAHSHNFNIVLFQIRGNGTAFYKSDIEPWAWELTGSTPSSLGTDPGWDPLAVACQEAKAVGIELHAYVNIFPGWRSTTPPPTEVAQLWNTHRDWFMQDINGTIMWPEGSWSTWYTFIDPGVPQVKQYLKDVFVEIVKNYPVDGVHYDYVRYPHEVGDFAYNATSTLRFEQQYGGSPQSLPEQWADWKRDQITEIVQGIYPELERLRPRINVSAAVNRNWSNAYNHASQNYRAWLSDGSLDMGVTMTYTANNADFTTHVTDQVANQQGRWVIPGLGIYLTDTATMLRQVDICRELGAKGLAMFSYATLFPEHNPNAMAQALLDGPFRSPARVPVMPWKKSSASAPLIEGY